MYTLYFIILSQLDNLTPIKCSFTHQMDQSTLDFIDSLQKTKSKEGLILIKKKLLDILKREMSSFKTPAVNIKKEKNKLN